MIRVARIYRGWMVVGRRRRITLKRLSPGIRAIKSGPWQMQAGRVLVRLAYNLCPDCRRIWRRGHCRESR